MVILAVDDEEPALCYLVRMLKEAQPGSEIHSFMDPFKALDFLNSAEAELAFLDVEMYGINGIELAKSMKDLRPHINIIFVTGYSDYAVDAFALHASGYLLKPASLERIRYEIENLRSILPEQENKVLVAHTFGNFEVFHNQKPLEFGRVKAKELLAYLIDRRGAGCTAAELCSMLWENKEYNSSLQKQFQTIVSELMRTLRQAGIEDVIIKKRNFISIDVSRIDCDYYRFLGGDVTAINSYMGEYMANYSWAEFTTGFLYNISQN